MSEEHNLYRLLLKQIWSFNFLDIPETINKIKVTYPDDEEINSMELGLNQFVDIYEAFTGN